MSKWLSWEQGQAGSAVVSVSAGGRCLAWVLFGNSHGLIGTLGGSADMVHTLNKASLKWARNVICSLSLHAVL